MRSAVRKVLLYITALTLMMTPLLGQNKGRQTVKVKLITKVAHRPVKEMSGIVKSRRYKDVWWVHNDSGDQARLFAINSKGQLIIPSFLTKYYWAGVKESNKVEWPGLKVELSANIDWEDIAIDRDTLAIADLGNNGNARRDLGLYILAEPNPRAISRCRIQSFLPLRYPDQKSFPARKWHFDCEALFISDGTYYMLTKHRQAGKISSLEAGTKLYRMDTRKTDSVNTLTLIESHKGLLAPTAADLSPNGRHLAVLTLTAIWIFEKPAKGDKWLSTKARTLNLPMEATLQAEGLSFDDDLHLRLVNEQRSLMTVDLTPYLTPKKPTKKKF
jgi:hypothetical protein